MFRVKICGVTNALDVQMVADAGADAMGLNFYAQSKRYVTIEQAIELAEDWPDGVARVGVFVNASTETIRETADLVELDWIQLHGDEPLSVGHSSPARKLSMNSAGVERQPSSSMPSMPASTAARASRSIGGRRESLPNRCRSL